MLINLADVSLIRLRFESPMAEMEALLGETTSSLLIQFDDFGFGQLPFFFFTQFLTAEAAVHFSGTCSAPLL